MKIKRLGVLLSAVLVFALIGTACSNGAGNEDTPENSDNTEATVDSLQRVLDAGKFTVVGSGGYPPFNYFDENGEVVGFDVDVGKEIAERLGVELDYVTSDWDGLTEGLRSKRYDAILGSMAITPDRLLVLSFSDPYYYSGAQLVVNKDSEITDPSQMEGKSIAVTTGTNFVNDVKDLGATESLYQDDNATMMELTSGRVDGVITDRLVALGIMGKISGGDNLTLCGKIMRLEEMGIAFNQDDDTLLEKVNEILGEMREDGTLREISEKWHNGADITVK